MVNGGKMKNIMVKNKLKKMEPGDGGISYAMYFIAVIVCLILFIFFKFNSDLYVAEEVLENGLHIAENRILTINNSGVVSEDDDFENELRRFHIVSSYDSTQATKTPKEESQLQNIAKEFVSTIQTQYELDGVYPKSGILKELCTDGSKVVISGPVYIYEPIYKRTVNVSNNGNVAGSSYKKFLFESKYDIEGWIKYTISYNDNVFSSSTKEFLSATPMLKNGSIAEGATIEASVTLQFAGVNNVFNMTPNNGNLHAPTAFFTNNPQREYYDVTVTQSADIVISSNDSRQK